jgi:MinD superfamily P-loop ATPase
VPQMRRAYGKGVAPSDEESTDMIVAVASGKGGTGKTTVAVNLALTVSLLRGQSGVEQVFFVDCDVEEPNAALFLYPTIERRDKVQVPIPEVDLTKCTFCMRCADVCRYNAMAVVRRQVLVFPELCHGCGSCVLNCPEGAIGETSRVTGVVEQGIAHGGVRFAQGILNIGEAMPVPILRQLKRQAIPEDTSSSLVILDAPPGTACPVVETIHGADMVLMVTEPTPFGLHDLRLAVQVARDELGLPVAVVINRDGIGDKEVEGYCHSQGLPVWMRIPMDRRIAEAYAEGQAIVEAFPAYKQRFLNLYQQIVAAVGQ